MTTIGERLRMLREKSGKSQGEVAKIIGISRPAYVSYETGRSFPSRKIRELAELFDVSTDYLLGGFSKHLLGDKPLFNSHDTDDETVEMENQMKYDPDYRTLYNAKKKLPPETIAAYMVILKRLMGENN